MAARSGVSWRWSAALRGAVIAAPAASVAASDLDLGAALAVGLLPVASLPLAARRAARVRSGSYGVLAAVSILLGGVLAQWPVLAVLGLLGAGVGLGRLFARRGGPGALVGLTLCLPLMAVGFSYPGVVKVAGLAALIALGTVWAVLVSLLWPEQDDPAAALRPVPPADAMVVYGWTAGLAGATCAAIGFVAGLEHVGWAPAAALLVMRPSRAAQRLRSLGRIVDVVLGAGAAVVLVLAGPPGWAYGLAVGVVVVAATATAGSRWYVLPTFTTYLVFLLLLAGDPDDARARFWERLLETALGVGVAALAVLVVPAVGGAVARRR